MLSIFLEIVDSLKICLALALLTGLFFGYLYTKLKALELYQPTVKKYKNSINQHKKSFKNAVKEQKNFKGEIENDEYKLKGINQSIFEYKNNYISKKELQVEMENKNKEASIKHEEKENILAHYTGEIEEVKKECRLDDISTIKENRDSMNRLISDKELLIKEKQNKFSMIQKKIKDLNLECSQIEEKLNELDKNSKNMALKIVERNDTLNLLKRDFLKENEAIYEKISLNNEEAKEYKEKLIKLKGL